MHSIIASILLIFIPIASAQCTVPADQEPCDGNVTIAELTAYIDIWYSCSACAPDLLGAINSYYNTVCSDDPACPSAGSFCEGKRPYTCSPGEFGCLERLNGSTCGMNQSCAGGFCVNDNESFAFVVYGDSRTGTTTHRTIVNITQQLSPDFVLHTGDFVATGSNAAEWNTFRQISGPLLYRQPSPGLASYFYPSFGNHETNSGQAGADLYFSVFNYTPINQYYYSFDYRNTHVISLYVTDTWTPSDFEPGSGQYEWLLNDLQTADSDPAIKWKFVFFHAPVFSCISSHGCGRDIQRVLMPLFDRYKVTAVFNGDDHSYERMGPLTNYSRNPKGTAYIIAAGAGASLYAIDLTDCNNWGEPRASADCDCFEDDWPDCVSYATGSHNAISLEYGASVFHLVKLTVNDTAVYGEAINTSGAVFDTFTLTRQEPVCSNGIREGGEQCDGSDFGIYGNGSGRCPEYNASYFAGDLTCSSCRIGTSQCRTPACGNGAREGSEQCDGSDFGIYGDGAGRCSQYSGIYTGGDLSCSGCSIWTGGCLPGACGDGTVNTGEECDDGNIASGDGCNASCMMEYSERTIYVDGRVSGSCSNYDPAARACAGGSATAFGTISAAAMNATAGTTVYIRNGTYAGSANQLAPDNSGAQRAPITFRNFGNEYVGITGMYVYAISIAGRSYIRIEGLNVYTVGGWGAVYDSDHITIRGNNFTDEETWIGFFFMNCTHSGFLNNHISGGGDNLNLIYSDRNLVEGNNISAAGHAIWTIYCGNFNIVRNNYFHNQLQKIGQVLDCNDPNLDNAVGYPVRHVNATRYNLIDNNTFAYTAEDRLEGGDPGGPFNGIQFAGQDSIIRRNLFFDNNGGGLGLTTYYDEAEYDTGNRVYNNVFYRNRFGGIQVSGSTTYAFYDNIMKNNIFFRNDFVNWNGVYDGWGWTNAGGKPFQVWVTTAGQGYVFDNNNILNLTSGENHVIAHADDYEYGDPANRSLAWWRQTHPSNYINNSEMNPSFMNENARDFRLQPGSPMINAGAFLTRTAGAGSGTSMQVADAKYFYDGYGIEGEQGDLMQLQGGGTARVTAINYANNTLTLDRSLNWNNGQGVSLAYSGSAPDIGAYESG